MIDAELDVSFEATFSDETGSGWVYQWPPPRYAHAVHPVLWPTDRDPFATLRESPDDECSYHSNGGEGGCSYCEESDQ